MKKMFIIPTLLFLFLVYSPAFSQEIDCHTKLNMRQAKRPYQINELSKSAICKMGEKYEYNIDLEKDRDYRLSFFASSVFNNKINFRILNKATGELIIDLPGVSIDNIQGCALQAYFDDKSNKMVHPFFDLSPDADTQLKIIIEVESEKSQYEFNTADILASHNQKKGCVTVFVQSKSAEKEGFR